MRISVVGVGRVGSALGPALAAAGHEVMLTGSRDEAKMRRLAASQPGMRVGSPLEAAGFGEVVVIALRFDDVRDFLTPDVAQALAGRVLVDVTNPVSATDFTTLALGFDTSAAEEIARLVPGARVVKAFNTLFSATMAAPSVDGRALTVFVAADDDDARATVLELAAEQGFDAVDAGPLPNARYLEPMAQLLIQLGYARGLGTSIGFGLLRAVP